MFSFQLPRGAIVTATTPDGVTLSLLHAGNGSFLSQVPPTVMAGIEMAGETPYAAGVPVTWDGATVPGDGDVQGCLFGFNVHSARDALFSAANAGDSFAQKTMKRMAEVAVAMDAGTGAVETVQGLVGTGPDSEGGTPD